MIARAIALALLLGAVHAVALGDEPPPPESTRERATQRKNRGIVMVSVGGSLSLLGVVGGGLLAGALSTSSAPGGLAAAGFGLAVPGLLFGIPLLGGGLPFLIVGLSDERADDENMPPSLFRARAVRRERAGKILTGLGIGFTAIGIALVPVAFATGGAAAGAGAGAASALGVFGLAAGIPLWRMGSGDRATPIVGSIAVGNGVRLRFDF